ncbi:TIM44-like domain-containing protein [Dechloromonas sp. ZY10]|uniref:Tim44 domain-containing protein n=1 Tax=Dechloromonas aquae TaxID=2664436 RepID=UPI003528D56C
MKNFALMAAALLLGATLSIGDAEAAKRFGGGSSTGMQRQSVAPTKSPTATPAQTPQAAPSPAHQQAAAPAAAPQAQPKRSWMGPLAGLAAGLGLAALASHFGFGEQLANMLMIGLLVMVVLAVIGFIMRKKAAAQAPAGNLQYAGIGSGFERPAPLMPAEPLAGGSAAPTAAPVYPAGFDAEGFVRNAKVNFIRLQAANDAGNLDDIREFTSPEMFAEIKLQMGERAQGKQETDVAQLNAEVLDVADEGQRYVVSVRFHGLIREDGGAPEAFDEVWHMTKPTDGSRGWVVAGIQQVN